jgi:hypothetical protein
VPLHEHTGIVKVEKVACLVELVDADSALRPCEIGTSQHGWSPDLQVCERLPDRRLRRRSEVSSQVSARVVPPSAALPRVHVESMTRFVGCSPFDVRKDPVQEQLGVRPGALSFDRFDHLGGSTALDDLERCRPVQESVRPSEPVCNDRLIPDEEEAPKDVVEIDQAAGGKWTRGLSTGPPSAGLALVDLEQVGGTLVAKDADHEVRPTIKEMAGGLRGSAGGRLLPTSRPRCRGALSAGPDFLGPGFAHHAAGAGLLPGGGDLLGHHGGWVRRHGPSVPNASVGRNAWNASGRPELSQ